MAQGLGTAALTIGTPAGRTAAMRRRLLATTALQAAAVILLASPAAAQPAAMAQPQGGAVVAGQASISQTSTQTTIAQTSQRAAIDWRSYNIGAGQTVTYQQPGASSITLNRVTGPDPSQIAGRIQANGQVALVNQSGVVFQAGSQVDVQSLVVSTAGVTNQNFMAGKMIFDQPGHTDAKISNAGTITVASTGLAALVAPQVANSGVITAKMGHVVLAGAEAHTVDLYGDGLMSVDVTRQVTKAPNGTTALVTNTGTINADGGTIVLTAKAADGIIQNLVSTKGTLQANTLGGKPGTIVVSATGGSITIEGAVRAEGRAPGAVGGTVTLAATDTVAVGAGAKVSASGRGGGGTVAVGTTPARARNQGGGVPAGSASTVTLAAGAHISADGKGSSSGGSVALLATGQTTLAGSITARGGRSGGNGGKVEVSGNSLAVTGTVDTRAPAGTTGTLLLDPATLTVTDAGTTSTSTDQVIAASAFNSMLSTNNVTLTATDAITLSGNTALQPSGGTYALSLTATNATSTVNVGVPLSANGPITLSAGGAITLSAPVSAGTNTLTLNAGSITQTAAGRITAGTLTGQVTDGTGTASSGHDVVLNNGANQIGTLGKFIVGSVTDTSQASPIIAPQGNFNLVDSVPLTVAGPVLAAGVSIAAPSMTVSGLVGGVSTVTLFAPGGVAVSGSAIDAPTVGIAGGLTVNGSGGVYGDTVTVTGPVAMYAGVLHANTLTLPGGLTFSGGDLYAHNDLAFTVGNAPFQPALIRTGGNLTINSSVGLSSAAGLLAGGNITITITDSFNQVGGALIAGGNITLTSTGGAVSQSASGVMLAGGTVRLNGLGAAGQGATIAGTIGASNLQLIEPGAALAITPALLVGGPSAPPTTQLNNTYLLPGSNAVNPSSTVTLTVTSGSGKPGTLRADAASLTLGTLSASTIELHSTGDTIQTGTLSANSLLGTAGYAITGFDASGLPTYDTATSLGSLSLSAAGNQISGLGPYYTGGSLSIQSATNLGVNDTLIAGPAQTIALAAPAIQVASTGSLRFGAASSGAFTTNTRPVTPESAVFVPSTTPATAASHSTVNLRADRLEIDGTGTAIDAPGGIVAIVPYTTGLAMSVDATRSAASLLSLPVADLSLINTLGTAADVGTGGPSTLRLGSLDGTAATASGLTINAPLALTNQAATLGLYATGTVSEALSGAITIGRPASGSTPAVTGAITGAAGADFLLGKLTDAAPANHADQLLTITAGRNLTVSEATDGTAGLSGVTVAGTLQAGGALSLLVNAGSGAAGALNFPSPFVISGGNATLIASGNLTGNSVRGTTVSLYAGGSAAVFDVGAGTLAGAAGGSFSAGGSFTYASASAGGPILKLNDSTPLTLIGQSGSGTGNVTIDAPAITSTGTLTAAGTIQLHSNGAGGTFTQQGGTIAAAGTVTIAGSSDTTPMGGSINQLSGTIASGTNLRLLAAGDAMQSGGATLAAPSVQVVSTGGVDSFAASSSANVQVAVDSRPIDVGPANLPLPIVTATTTLSTTPPTSVRLDGAALSLQGTAAASTVTLHATGSMTESGTGVIQATTLTGTAGYAATGTDATTGLPIYASLSGNPGGTAVLNNPLNNVQRLGDFQARSGFTFSDTPSSGSLVIAGLVRSGLGSDPATSAAAAGSGASLSIRVGGTNSALTVGDATSPTGALVGNQVTLITNGALTESAQGLVAAGTLSGTAATSSLAPTAGNQVAQVGDFTSIGGFTLANTPGFTVSGALNAGSANVNLATPGGTINESGSITAGTLTLNAGQVTAQSGTNAVSALSSTTTAGGLAFTNSKTLLTTGVSATGGDVTLSSGGDLTLQGKTSVGGGGLNLAANGNVTLAAGNTAAAATLTSKSGGATSIGGTITAGSTINLAAGTTLTLSGSETAPRLVAGAPVILLQGGALTVGGVVQAKGTPASALPGAGTTPFTFGAQFEAGSTFTQSGTTAIGTAAGFAQSTVRIDLTSGTGSVSFATFDAPNTNLGLGLASGKAAGGAIMVNNLGVTYTGAGRVDLTGTVGNQPGPGAATASTISPNKSAMYEINSCAIGSVNCVILRPQAVPVSNPLKELSLTFFRDQDDTLVVPNVTEQGL